MLHNFSFLIDGEIAGSARPGLGGSIGDDLEFMRGQGIDAVVSLTETAPDFGASGMILRHLPVPDFQPPTPAQMDEFVEFVRRHTEAGGRVLVHCHAGIGRTGTMLAAWLVAKGMTPEEAVDAVREARPGSIETPAQVRSLAVWAKSRPPG